MGQARSLALHAPEAISRVSPIHPPSFDPKRLELLSELVPTAGIMGLLLNRNEIRYVDSYTMQEAAHEKRYSSLSSGPGAKTKSTPLSLPLTACMPARW